MTSHGHLAPGAVPGLFALALALALAPGAPPASAQAVQWRPDYGAARREAAAHKRLLVLVFSAESCPWCRQMERTTLRDPEVVGVLNRRFVPVKVAADDARNGSLVSGLGLQGLPAVVLVAPGGQVLATREGYLDAAGFLALLDRALAHLAEKAPGRIWHGYHVSAVDDTKVHRSGDHVWGTCTFHESAP
jgi:thiol:disulfide interchange protein